MKYPQFGLAQIIENEKLVAEHGNAFKVVHALAAKLKEEREKELSKKFIAPYSRVRTWHPETGGGNAETR